MGRRNHSFQELFLNSLDAAGTTAMRAGGMLADNRRAEAADARAVSAEARDKETHAATLKAKQLDYDKAFKEETLRAGLGQAATDQSTALEGAPTADGHAVDFQAVKKGNRGFEQADMALWNYLNPGTPMNAGQLAEKRGRDVAGDELAASEKEADATRKQEKHDDDMATGKEQRRLLGAQTNKATRGGNGDDRYQIVEIDGRKVKVNMDTDEKVDLGPATQKREAAPGSDLPIDKRKQVESLSSKNAEKISIANQIESDMAEFESALGIGPDGKPLDNLPPGFKPDVDRAVRIGGFMLKTLNSKEGADAIGVEEAKRLGDALEFNIFDVKAGMGVKPGNLMGRDLPGFQRQARANMDGIRRAAQANQSQIDKHMGRDAAGGTPTAGQVEDGYRFKGGNPADPNSWEKM